MNIHIHINMHMHIHIHVNTHTHRYIYTCTYTYASKSMSTRIRVAIMGVNKGAKLLRGGQKFGRTFGDFLDVPAATKTVLCLASRPRRS